MLWKLFDSFSQSSHCCFFILLYCMTWELNQIFWSPGSVSSVPLNQRADGSKVSCRGVCMLCDDFMGKVEDSQRSELLQVVKRFRGNSPQMVVVQKPEDKDQPRSSLKRSPQVWAAEHKLVYMLVIYSQLTEAVQTAEVMGRQLRQRIHAQISETREAFNSCSGSENKTPQ